MSTEEFALTETIRSLLLKEHATSDLTAAYFRSDFHDALTELEQSFTAEPRDLEKKLWWMLFQLEAEKVPVTALSSSVEELFEECKTQEKLTGLLGAVLLRAAVRLTKRDQMRLAISMVDHFEQCCGSKAAVSKFLLEIARREQKRIQALPAVNQGREKQYLAQLEDRIRKLEQNAAAAPAVDKAHATPPVLPPIVPPGLTQELPDTIIPPKTNSPALRLTVAGLVVVALGFFSARYLHHPSTSQPTTESIGLLGVQAAPQLPELARKTMATLPRSDAPEALDSVTERLQDMGKSNSANAADNSQPVGDGPVNIASNQTAPSFATPQDAAKMPELNPNRLSSNTPTSLDNASDGSALARAPVDANGIRKSPDGRVFGPAPDQRAGSLDGARGLDGGPVQPVQVEELSKPRMYRMKVRSKVFSAPSVVARTVSQLDSGSKIEVVARFGRWLEIRSLRGNRGYIYAQDAEPLN